MNKFLILCFFALLALALKAQNAATMVIYPNPFCDEVFIRFNLPSAEIVTINIFNTSGQQVATIVDAETFNAGEYLLNPGIDSLPNDIYIIRFNYGDSSIIKKAVKRAGCTTTSIANDKLSSFKTYPNPNPGFLYVNYEGYKQIEITNLQGQVCKKLDTDINAIDLSGLPSGTYILNVFDNEHRLVAKQRIVKE